jgi:hypothetical protein
MFRARLFFIFFAVFFLGSGFAFSQEDKEQLPSVCVTGIMYDAENSLAVVNGESVRQGEQLRGVKIVKISESTVSFEYEGKAFEKRIGDGCTVSPFAYKKELQITKIIAASPKSSASRNSSRRAPPLLPYESLFLITILTVSVLFYIYNSLCLHKIANKTKTPFGWFAWLPIFNVFLMLMIARKTLWWFLLLLLPLINIVCVIILWMEIARMRNKPAWLGILMMLPIANFFIIGYLAFSR